MAATYNVPANKYLQYGIGTTVGLQYELNKKLNIFANYTNFINQFKTRNGLNYIIPPTNQFTIGGQYYLNKNKSLFVTAEGGVKTNFFKDELVVGIGAGYTKKLSNRLTLDVGTKYFYYPKGQLNKTTLQFYTALKFRL